MLSTLSVALSAAIYYYCREHRELATRKRFDWRLAKALGGRPSSTSVPVPSPAHRAHRPTKWPTITRMAATRTRGWRRQPSMVRPPP